jgi:hypothetical protein
MIDGSNIWNSLLSSTSDDTADTRQQQQLIINLLYIE